MKVPLLKVSLLSRQHRRIVVFLVMLAFFLSMNTITSIAHGSEGVKEGAFAQQKGGTPGPMPVSQAGTAYQAANPELSAAQRWVDDNIVVIARHYLKDSRYLANSPELVLHSYSLDKPLHKPLRLAGTEGQRFVSIMPLQQQLVALIAESCRAQIAALARGKIVYDAARIVVNPELKYHYGYAATSREAMSHAVDAVVVQNLGSGSTTFVSHLQQLSRQHCVAIQAALAAEQVLVSQATASSNPELSSHRRHTATRRAVAATALTDTIAVYLASNSIVLSRNPELAVARRSRVTHATAARIKLLRNSALIAANPELADHYRYVAIR
ncbi:MAG: hypothetical protein GXP38_13130 [Chloroflexi bacterium]|nr:hypothetical protein [Chloroflexota bacterium]